MLLFILGAGVALEFWLWGGGAILCFITVGSLTNIFIYRLSFAMKPQRATGKNLLLITLDKLQDMPFPGTILSSFGRNLPEFCQKI